MTKTRTVSSKSRKRRKKPVEPKAHLLKAFKDLGVIPEVRIGDIRGRDTFYRPETITIKQGANKGTWRRA